VVLTSVVIQGVTESCLNCGLAVDSDRGLKVNAELESDAS
jgi:hypothetical protein